MRLSLHKNFNQKDALNCTAYFIYQMHFLRSRVIKNIPDAHSFDLHLNKNRFPNIQVKEKIRYLTFYTRNILNGQFDIKCKCVFYIIGLVALLHQDVNYCNTQKKEMLMIIHIIHCLDYAVLFQVDLSPNKTYANGLKILIYILV